MQRRSLLRLALQSADVLLPVLTRRVGHMHDELFPAGACRRSV